MKVVNLLHISSLANEMSNPTVKRSNDVISAESPHISQTFLRPERRWQRSHFQRLCRGSLVPANGQQAPSEPSRGESGWKRHVGGRLEAECGRCSWCWNRCVFSLCSATALPRWVLLTLHTHKLDMSESGC